MANIPGATSALPGVFSDIVTQSRGLAVPVGSRIAAIIGEGSTDEVLVSQANGGGNDGLNSSYTSTSGADGRHFRLSNFPVVENRTSIFLDGVKLVGTESLIDNNTFPNKYDYRLDISTGKIELQRAHLVDQGGANYTTLSTNVGDGYLSDLTLKDVNAPPETWTIRCVSVQRNLGVPLAGTAKFLAFGSVSGAQLDANGNPIIWVADGYKVSNGIIEFAIWERMVGGNAVSPFREGDGLIVQVASGVLTRSQSLTANYIPTANLNDPLLLLGMDDVVKRHGSPSLDNNLSLGCQLAFANSSPSVITVQAAPAMPKRTSYILNEAMNSSSLDQDDFIFPLPAGVTPFASSEIHFFLNDNSTNEETQILPNKYEYYLLDTGSYPTTETFVFDPTPAPTGYSYSYTVKQSFEVLNTGFDGYIARLLPDVNKGLFSSSVTFDASYVGMALKIIDTANSGNIGLFKITAVTNGKLSVIADGSVMHGTQSYNEAYLSDFINEEDVAFEVIDISSGLPLDGYSGTDGYIVKSVGTGTATLTSATVDFSTVPNIDTDYRLQINGSAVGIGTLPMGNDGLYDISNQASFEITITKAFVDESEMRYEILNPLDVSNYIVINKNVVPATGSYQLRVSLIDDRDAAFYDAGWIDAITSLELIDCDIVVPLPKQTISIIFQNTLSHCKFMSNIKNRKERVMFCGAISGLTYQNVLGDSDVAVENIGVLEGIQGDNVTEVQNGNIEDLANYSVADAFGNTFRCVYFFPDQIIVQAGTDNVTIDGFYIAAAAAGYECADLRLENPITNKVFSGFSISRSKLLPPSVLERLGNSGITTLQPVSGGGRVVWGVTTSQSGFVEEQEISIVFIRDRVAKVLRSAFRGFIGNAEISDTQLQLTSTATITLNSLLSQRLITNYKDLVVKRDSVDPRQWNISVRVQPPYPVNYIYIRVELGQL